MRRREETARTTRDEETPPEDKTRARLERADCGQETECSGGCLATLVTFAAADAIDGLLMRLDGEDAEAHRDTGCHPGVRDTTGGLARDVLEVRSVAANDAGENHDSIKTRLSAVQRRQSNLERAGHRYNHDVGHTPLKTLRDGTIDQRLDDVRVILSRHNRDPRSGIKRDGL